MNKHNSNRRKFLKLAAGGLGAALAASCAPPVVTPTSAPAQPTTSSSLPTAVPARRATINFWDMEGRPDRQAIWDSVAQNYMAINPHIDIQVLHLTVAEGETKMLAGLETGVLPDVVFPVRPQTQVLVEAGKVLELTEYFNNWDEAEHIEPSLVIAQRNQMPGGGLYCIPHRQNFGVQYYRNKWFDEAGLDPIVTMADTRAAAEALTDTAKGRAGYIVRGGAGSIGIPMFYGLTFSMLPFYNADGTSNYGHPDFVEGVKFWLDFTLDGLAQSTAATDDYPSTVAVFHGDGGAILEHNTGSLPDHLAKLGEDEFRASFLPIGPKGKRLLNELTGNGGFVVSTSPELEAAVDFYLYVNSAEAAGYFNERNGTPPANRLVYEQEWFQKNPFWPQLMTGLSDGNTLYTANVPNPLLTAYLQNVAEPALQACLLGQKDAQSWCEELGAEATRTMQQYMSEAGITSLNVEPHP